MTTTADMIRRVAARHVAAPQLRNILKELADLEELDENINEVLDTFGVHFRTASDTAVMSQWDAWQKAKSGLKSAEWVQSHLKGVLAQYPDDKTANRAMRDAEVMIKRFSRNEDKAKRMVKRLAKKQLPPALKDAATKTVKALRKLLEDPRSLTTHVTADKETDKETGVKGARYVSKIFVALEGVDDLEIQMILGTTWKSPSVRVGIATGPGSPRWNPKKWSLGNVTAMFMEAMEGRPELKGEGRQISKRLRLAPDIAQEMSWYANRMGDTYNREPEISKDGRTIEMSFRTQFDERDYGQYEDVEPPNYEPGVVKQLSEYKSVIKSIDVGYGEKGWFYITVTLK